MSATSAGDISNIHQLTRIEDRLDVMQTTTDARFERMEERFEPLERIAVQLERLAGVATTALDVSCRAFRVLKWAAIAVAGGSLAEIGHLIAGRILH